MNTVSKFLFVLTILFTGPGPYWSAAQAHEFWVEPVKYTVQLDEPISANLKVGQKFGGSRYPYLSARAKQFRITNSGGITEYKGTEGDLPAFTLSVAKPGLNTITYISAVESLTFRNWEKFTNYLAYEGLDWAAQAHRDAGLPDEGFAEEYSRYAKALVQVGPYNGQQDRVVGMPVELVALASPYDPKTIAARAVPVQLLWRGKPLADQQINIFTKRAEVRLTHVRTDSAGKAVIPFPKGSEILINAVHLQRAPANRKAVWESFWASMTFGS